MQKSKPKNQNPKIEEKTTSIAEISTSTQPKPSINKNKSASEPSTMEELLAQTKYDFVGWERGKMEHVYIILV